MSFLSVSERIEKAKISGSSSLDLSGLRLRKIPLELSEVTHLTELNLSENRLFEINGLEKLVHLANLNLGHNKILDIKGFEKLTQLKKLNLSNNYVTRLKGLEQLTQLRELNLSSNRLKEIKGLHQHTQLTNLDLSFNKFKEIKGLEQLFNLTDLDLSNNQLTEIQGFEQLTQLIRLKLWYNLISEIKGLETLTHLTKLDLGHNEIYEIKGLEQLTQLSELKLAQNKVTQIKGFETLKQLTKLDLNNNHLIKLKGIEQVSQLTKLYLSYNRLTEIKGLEQLTQLTILNLTRNQLTEIKELGQLSKITILYLNYNKLTEIKELEQLTQLTYLNLAGNELTELKGLENLKNLYQLTLSDNQLSKIPEFLLELGLSIIWKSGSIMLTEPEQKGIFVGNNPFINPPAEIIKEGNKAIQEYFDQRKKSGEELLNEAKLILLGDGRSGKTSLANRLLGKELPQEDHRTQGVNIMIGEYSFSLANGRDFRINIWDFAGQDKYKTLHQLFYSESSLYVMVSESGNLNTDFDDWFQTAALFGEGSPLLLVLNEFKTGIGMGSFDSSYWKKQFPELLKEVFTVNLRTMQNFSTAEEYIRLLAQTLPHTKYAFPSNWAAIRRVLNERRNDQYLTLKEYFAICKDNNLPERESALILSSVLHKVGDCLHYQKSELLKQFIILKNEWATEAVYKILDDKVVAEDKCGFFNTSDLERIWNNSEYEDMRPQLLELMKQFKLAYQLPGKNEFVTPPLLPPAKPLNFSWPDLDSLELYIEYEFLPKALLTQFIVTRHADIAQGRTLVWRHGVILKWGSEALGEVSKTKLQGRDAFYIRTQGNTRKEMMTVILKTFRELHAEYKGIKYKEKVPCICVGCKTGKNKQYHFDFDNLQFRLERGRHEVECGNSLELVNVMKLLENAFVFEKFEEGRTLQLKNRVKQNGSQIHIVNIFLASSNELINEREKIEKALARKNKSLRTHGFLIDLLTWEDGKLIGKSIRSQDNYNFDIGRCDFFVMLFYSKVGKYSLEEFELAYSLFENKELPRICVFQKDVDLPKNLLKSDADSRYNFLERLKQIEHFPTLFENTDKLINDLEDFIDKLLQDEAFITRLKAE